MLEAIRLLDHACHLNASGCNSYAHHLLFQRLYEPVVEQFDGIAEHAVRLGATIDPCEIGKQAYEWNERWEDPDCLARALKAEDALQRALSVLIGKAGKEIGLDNTLRGLADDHSTAIYLLKQAMKGAC